MTIVDVDCLFFDACSKKNEKIIAKLKPVQRMARVVYRLEVGSCEELNSSVFATETEENGEVNIELRNLKKNLQEN